MRYDEIRDAILKKGHIRARTMRCPCGSGMRFDEFNVGEFYYACEKFPANCDVTIRAHESGEPMGKPADAKTRYWRSKAHACFDALWRGYSGHVPLFRRVAYGWLSEKMGMGEVHIGELNEYGCKRVLTACHGILPKDIEAWHDAKGIKPSTSKYSEAQKKALAARGIFVK